MNHKSQIQADFIKKGSPETQVALAQNVILDCLPVIVFKNATFLLIKLEKCGFRHFKAFLMTSSFLLKPTFWSTPPFSKISVFAPTPIDLTIKSEVTKVRSHKFDLTLADPE